MSNWQPGDQENFISIPLGMDCRVPGRKSPVIPVTVKQDWKDAPGITFGRDWQANDWRKDGHDDK